MEAILPRLLGSLCQRFSVVYKFSVMLVSVERGTGEGLNYTTTLLERRSALPPHSRGLQRNERRLIAVSFRIILVSRLFTLIQHEGARGVMS